MPNILEPSFVPSPSEIVADVHTAVHLLKAQGPIDREQIVRYLVPAAEALEGLIVRGYFDAKKIEELAMAEIGKRVDAIVKRETEAKMQAERRKLDPQGELFGESPRDGVRRALSSYVNRRR